MDRRNFIRMLAQGVAATTAVRTFPFRVYSFPAEVVAPNFDLITYTTLESLRQDVLYDNFFVDDPWLLHMRRETEKWHQTKTDPMLEAAVTSGFGFYRVDDAG